MNATVSTEHDAWLQTAVHEEGHHLRIQKSLVIPLINQAGGLTIIIKLDSKTVSPTKGTVRYA